jgi:hypothetical protein
MARILTLEAAPIDLHESWETPLHPAFSHIAMAAPLTLA